MTFVNYGYKFEKKRKFILKIIILLKIMFANKMGEANENYN